MSAVEVLATGQGVGRSVIGVRNGAEYQVDLLHQLGSSERQVQARACVKDDQTTLWIFGAGVLEAHAENLRLNADD